MRARNALLALAALAASCFAPPAQAQTAIGETGLTVSGSLAIQSDYLFRGISQTGSRMAGQATAEVLHSSGLYIGGFISNVYFTPAGAFPQRAEIDGLVGFRFTALDINFDVGAVWYTYHGQRAGFGRLNYAEAVIKAAREIGPVTVNGTVAFSPNFFGSSGFGAYVEGGADWATGFQGIVLGGRVGYQHVERTAVFGAPSYANWNLTVSRTFDLGSFGNVVASVGYFDTSIGRSRCVPIAGGGQNICGPRALGALTWKF